MSQAIPVIDLFAGPGGLSEGFSACRRAGRRVFGIALSIEKEEQAHRTLELRSFFRQFDDGEAPEAYYDVLRGVKSIEELYAAHDDQYSRAKKEAWRAELGHPDPGPKTVDRRIRTALRKYPNGEKQWVLIGGPPCQAYSLVGRSRRAKETRSEFERDERHFLYREYLRILSEHRPPIFLVENVKGLLSSQIGGKLIVEKMLHDLRRVGYVLHPLAPSVADLFGEPDPADFVIRADAFGVPQARHRVILLGVREDLAVIPSKLSPVEQRATVNSVVRELPVLRSRVSGEPDDAIEWAEAIVESLAAVSPRSKLGRLMRRAAPRLRVNATVGGEFLQSDKRPEYLSKWFHDPRLGGVCNHTARSHCRSDLARYFFSACYSKLEGVSPSLHEFPEELLPDHKNVHYEKQVEFDFADRFRVQMATRPASTVTSHIAKDGHYYIHPDPLQCRSLTVREAARLQTFPDNYFFTGPRTSQYQQVGNAVPPLLAMKIADIVFSVLCNRASGEDRQYGSAVKGASQLEHVSDRR